MESEKRGKVYWQKRERVKDSVSCKDVQYKNAYY